ncbi:unnamed protein product [Clavelina lepadiformis]|uniref:Uncharacterized protein n=1 Tax=Clavelina lepadiformis TaxID=159417 RepID=A0ABP0EZC0_CLALP
MSRNGPICSNKACKSCCSRNCLPKIVCCDGTSKLILKHSRHVTKVFIIVISALSLIATETALFYLDSINISWKRGVLPKFSLHRIIMIISLITTIALLIILIRQWKLRMRDLPESEPCLRCKVTQSRAKEKVLNLKNWQFKSWNFVDFVHSFLLASTYLACAVCMVIDIPNEYEHHL